MTPSHPSGIAGGPLPPPAEDAAEFDQLVRVAHATGFDLTRRADGRFDLRGDGAMTATTDTLDGVKTLIALAAQARLPP